MPSPSRFKAILQLFRLPNVFTAIADVLAGFLITHSSLAPFGALALLVAASALLYTAGMVLNDVYDVEVDAQERPERPIPSGRIAYSIARLIGFEMLIIGTALGWTAAFFTGDLRPGVVASVLALTIWLYDGLLKRTMLAPFLMGGCRFLNVLLGMSVAAEAWQIGHWMIAAGIGVYIVGVTWFARTEARESPRSQLVAGLALMLAGIGLLVAFPQWLAASLPAQQRPWLWGALWILLAMPIVVRCMRAILSPTPGYVQAAVKQCILSLIVLDAGVVFARHGTRVELGDGIGSLLQSPGMHWVFLVLLLLVPTTLLGRWIYST